MIFVCTLLTHLLLYTDGFLLPVGDASARLLSAAPPFPCAAFRIPTYVAGSTAYYYAPPPLAAACRHYTPPTTPPRCAYRGVYTTVMTAGHATCGFVCSGCDPPSQPAALHYRRASTYPTFCSNTAPPCRRLQQLHLTVLPSFPVPLRMPAPANAFLPSASAINSARTTNTYTLPHTV